ncbi:NADP-dependent isocitrate dehydrogenase [Hydrogenophaga sp.]|uniref:NADP-dependent isocitrate dehydrogenase n=1 Tax=Hydrogenophaga sp. TaxID=1904254 RepID=UPI0019A8169E|nr:NADP-dependent isocitrate dehydrogenase [Hydrogenophaga sp.]MBD3893058.1 NADP-dependent isocitrate dehydrogenase [Hydrogenophaga sp.]
MKIDNPSQTLVSGGAAEAGALEVLTPITVAYGDGIGPEIMEATLKVLQAAGARIAPEMIEIGEKLYRSGHSSGIAPEAWDSLRRTKVFLKSPITTPSGGGYKSLNVTIRKTLGLYANVRPCVSYSPFVATKHPKLNLVIVRENEEDLYAGIEHRQTDEVFQCLKLITRPGCEKIVRYAFEYARANGRHKVTCMSKDNIMKMTDGLFHQVFDEIRVEYPQIASDHMIIDIGAARLATRPELFDVIVTPNLYGDIISDVAAEMTGSVGLAGSANIGEHVAMFEAIHGSAPDIAGKGIANPSGLLLGAVMMLVHIRQADVAAKVHNAWLCTLEDGVFTADLQGQGRAQIGRPFGSMDFADAIVERLGRLPQQFKPISYQNPPLPTGPVAPLYVRRPAAKKAMVGVDVFVHQSESSADVLALHLQANQTPALRLLMITNRGVKVWPGGFPETFCTDHWRCRFMAAQADGEITQRDIVALLGQLTDAGVDVIKTENLCTFDGVQGFALGQGQ